MSAITSVSSAETKKTEDAAVDALSRDVYKKARNTVLEGSGLDPTEVALIKVADDLFYSISKSNEEGVNKVYDGAARVVEDLTDAALQGAALGPAGCAVGKIAKAVDTVLPAKLSIPEESLPPVQLPPFEEFIAGLSAEGASLFVSGQPASRAQVLVGLKMTQFLRDTVHAAAHPSQAVADGFISMLETLPPEIQSLTHANQLISFFRNTSDSSLKNSRRTRSFCSCTSWSASSRHSSFC